MSVWAIWTVHCSWHIGQPDSCSQWSSQSDTPEEARKHARRSGWFCGTKAQGDYCPLHRAAAGFPARDHG